MSDRTYEILFIADPNLGEPEVDALAAQVQGHVEKDGGKLQKMAHHNVHVPSYNMGAVESVHSVLFHYLLDTLYEKFKTIA